MMKNFSEKSCIKYQNTHFTSNKFFFFFFLENRAVYKIKWKNIADPDRPQMTTGRMRIAYWIPTAISTNIVLIAFSLQQYLHERASMLHYT
jgi:hypothetical protein